MKKRKIADKFQVQELYRIGDLVAWSQGTVTYQQMRRAILAYNLKTVRIGRSVYIPMQELKERIPNLWEAFMRAKEER